MAVVLGAERSSQSTPPDGILRFGNFEVDTRAGELRRGGLKIKLHGQPFDVLVALLQKPGQVVTREELHQKLWSQDTFVDFEHGLNKAINRIREALGDDADNPRFIETLPRRGYRFLAPVTLPKGARSTKPLSAAEQAQSQTLVVPLEVRLKPFWIWAAALGVAAISIAVIALVSATPRTPRVLRYTQLTYDGLRKSGPLATDGSRVFFPEKDSQHVFIAQVSVNGGPTAPLVNFGPKVNMPCLCIEGLDFSPVRSELLIVLNRNVLAVNDVGDSEPRHVGALVADDAAWSADGQSIAYGLNNAVWVAKSDGSDSRRIASVQGRIVHPSWSPNGTKIRFAVDFGGENSRFAINSGGVPGSLWEVGTDGSNLHHVFSDWQSRVDAHPSWTPDGRYFLFNEYRTGPIYSVAEPSTFLARRKATPVRLTTGPMSFYAPVPSRDGKKIFALGSLNQGELMRYDSKTRTWVPFLSGISAADLDFSRDGEWVTYVLVPEGTLWRSRVDGSERRQLTIPPFRASMPRWSPDTRQVAFVGLKPGGSWSIYLISANGGEPELLAAPREKYLMDPNWSADGRQIVFGETADQPKAIHVLDLQSRHVSDLPGSIMLFSPRWSPDGKTIAADTGFNVPHKLMIFDIAGQTWRDCCRIDAAYPAFSRDGKYVYFSNSNTASFQRVRLADGKVESVATIDVPGGMKQDDFWYWSGLAPDDSPLVTRDASPTEIYALDMNFP